MAGRLLARWRSWKLWQKVLVVAAIGFVALIVAAGIAGAVGGKGNKQQNQVVAKGTPKPTKTAAPSSTPKSAATPKPTKALEPSATSKPSATPKLTATPKPTAIPHSVTGAPGAFAEAEHVRVMLNEIADPWTSDNQFIQPDPGKRFVAFDVTIEYTAGDGTHGANPFNFKLTDAQSFAYDVSFFGPEPSLQAIDLGSHQKTRGWITFDVNEGTGLGVLTYDPDIFTNTDVEFHFQ